MRKTTIMAAPVSCETTSTIILPVAAELTVTLPVVTVAAPVVPKNKKPAPYQASQNFATAGCLLAWVALVKEKHNFVAHHGHEQAAIVGCTDEKDDKNQPTGNFVLALLRGEDFRPENRPMTMTITPKQARTKLWASEKLEPLVGGQLWVKGTERTERERLLA